MKKILLALIASTTILQSSAQETFKFGTSTNPEGNTVLVDRYGMIMDGKHCIPVMGEIHYARVPEQDWRREIQKMKAGGITVLSTYVFWIHHEAEEGKWDWTGNKNLHRFLQICKEENMPVVLRVGPFCHGEVYQGGFPEWIAEKAKNDPKQYKLRSEAPGFIAATRSLFSNIYAQSNEFLWKNGGTIIGMQIENECRGPWSYYMKLKDMAVQIGFDVPFYTRTGWPKLNGKEEFGKLLPLYGDYADGFWDRVLTDMPGEYSKAFIMKDTRVSGAIATETFGTNQDTKMDKNDLQYPYLTCELGGGMMPSYHRRINISGHEIVPLAICKLGSGSNLPGYYMYHGGTNPYNPQHTMAETQATSVTNYNDMPYMTYDFQSPLGEMGQLNTTAFHESRWLHQFLADWGEELSVMDVDTLSENYARRGCFEFCNDYVRIKNEGGRASVTPKDMMWEGMKISSSTVQPFAKADGGLYFITIKGVKKYQLTVDGKTYNLKLDKTTKIKGKNIMLLSYDKAKTAFAIDGKMYYAKRGGILLKSGEEIVENYWQSTDDVEVTTTKVQDAKGLREVKMGSQKVAAMPEEGDFKNAAVWTLDLKAEPHPSIKTNVLMTMDLQPSALDEPEGYFLEISYKGDVARLYADGKLIEDNFWNGKPMLVRLSDIAHKKVELKILPLGKDYPIYLQKEQKDVLQNAESGTLLSLDNIKVVKEKFENIK